MNVSTINCYRCHTPLSYEKNAFVGRGDECPKCYAPLHSCRMCTFYDPQSYNSCKEPTADRILEKDKANFCDFFSLTNCTKADNKESFTNAAEALFKK